MFLVLSFVGKLKVVNVNIGLASKFGRKLMVEKNILMTPFLGGLGFFTTIGLP